MELSTDLIAPRPDEPKATFESLLLLTFLVFGLIIGPEGAVVTIALGLIALAALLGAQVAPRWNPTAVTALRVLAIGSMFSLFFVAGSIAKLNVSAASTVFGLMLLPVTLVFLSFLWRGDLAANGTRWVLAGVLVVTVAAIAVVAIAGAPEPTIDVQTINRAGADALARGENPYVTATAENTNPYAEEGSEFTGYVYPPLALVLYSLSDWFLGDPRWVNALAIVIFVILLARPWAYPSREVSAALLVLGLMYAIQPGLGFILRYSWTEPIALPFLVVGGMLWRRKPLFSAVMLGLGFATKQYFFLVFPLLLFWDDDFRWKRTGIVAGVAAATMLPFLILDPVAFWNATVAPSFAIAPRPDGTNLVGLGVEFPDWVALAVPFLLAFWLGRRGGRGAAFLAAVAAVMATSFMLGFQAFANYWFLIVALMPAALVVRLADDAAVPEAAAAEIEAATGAG
jgi:hypothetical protein